MRIGVDRSYKRKVMKIQLYILACLPHRSLWDVERFRTMGKWILHLMQQKSVKKNWQAGQS